MNKYDLEIVMPVSMQDKYLKRLDDFKKYGLRNIGDYKIKLVLLTGVQEIPEILVGWDEKIDVEYQSCELDHHAAKVNFYYKKLFEKEDLSYCKWFVRLDDDSLTNISSLMYYLSELDENEKHFLCAELFIGDTSVERDLLTKMNIYSPWKFNITHEIECCILSYPMMKHIASNEVARNFIEERSKIPEGYTDIALATAAKICKMIVIHVPFLSSEPRIDDFFVGKKAHIHKLAHDVNRDKFNIVKSFYNKDKNFSFTNKEIVLGTRNEETGKCDGIFCIELNSDGHVLVLAPPRMKTNECFWDYNEKDSILYFLDRHGTFLYSLDLEDVPKLNHQVGKIFLKSL